jgi:hypothetical protein
VSWVTLQGLVYNSSGIVTQSARTNTAERQNYANRQSLAGILADAWPTVTGFTRGARVPFLHRCSTDDLGMRGYTNNGVVLSVFLVTKPKVANTTAWRHTDCFFACVTRDKTRDKIKNGVGSTTNK